MPYCVDGYMEHLYKTHRKKYDIDKIKNKEDLHDFQNGLYGDYLDCLGGMPEKRPLDIKTLEEVQRDGFTRVKIEYTADQNFRAPAYILVPDSIKTKNAAVIALTGHGYGAADIVGLTEKFEEKPADGDPGYQKNFAVELVKRGFIVAAPELFGFGELMLAPNSRHLQNAGNSCFMLTTQLLMYKKTMAALRVWQAECMFDYLAGTRTDVDPEKIGVMGISGGGLASSFFAAYNKRVKACVVSGYLCTFKDSIMSIYHCVDNFPPGMLNLGEMADIFGLIAPRPLLFESGTNDDIFPIDGVKSSYARIEELYSRLGAGENLEIDIFGGAHQISGAKAYDFLLKQL
ncbi:MAG: alpha/beta hydrolase family protein [Oscillospiraceae bacterium]|nr:alpha/beta hydrolase family protein [Oscillospiraceae bacterium]